LLTTSVVDTGGKLIDGVINIGRKFAAGIATISVCLGKGMTTGINGTGSIFAAGGNDTSDAPCLSCKYLCQSYKTIKLALKKLAGDGERWFMKQ
jgi:hypothetical protein